MKKLVYLIVAIAVLGLIVPGCIPVVPPSEESDVSTLTKNGGPIEVWVDDDAPTEWYVDPTHFATIQEGVAAVADYCTVYVLAGTYNVHIINQYAPYNKSFNLIGAGSDVVTWTAPSGQYPLQLDQQSDVSYEISGFKFLGDGAHCIKFAGGGFEDLDVHDNVFEDVNAGLNNFGLFMCRIAASRTDGVSSIRVHDNVFNTKNGICMSNAVSFDIYKNEFNVNVEGIYSGAGCKTSFIVGDHKIYQNTFTGLLGDAIKLDYWADGHPDYLVSTIDYNNFENIGGYAVNVTTDRSITENATCNWWGHASGPSGEGGRWNSAHTKIIGKGDAVSLNVNWDPRLPQPVDHTPHHPVPTGLLIDTVKVGLVFDIGDVEHLNTFNDSAYQGIEWATADFNIEHIELEPEEAEDREEYLRILALMDCDLVIGVGWLFTDAITTVADEFPDTKFAIIDGYELIPDIPNLVSLLFKEHEGSFLVGMIAGLKAKDDDKDTVGFVGGRDIPLIHKFEAGYKAGVQYVYPKCKILSDYAGAFDDPAKGKELALAQYDEGAWVIYHASGATGEGVFEAGKERKRYVIGVDYNQNYKGYIEETGESFGLTSMLKQVNVIVYLTIKSVVEGTFEGGIELFGLDTEVTIGGKLYYGVDYALDEYNEHSVTPEMIAQVEEARELIRDGEIIVPEE